MLLRYSSKMSAINGICRSCDYSMKWLVLQGSPSTSKSLSVGNPTVASPAFATRGK